MKILIHLLIIVAAAAIGLAAGFALRGKSRAVSGLAESPGLNSASLTGSQATSIRASNRRAGVRLTDDSPLATKLQRDLSMSTGVTRWLYWLEAIEKATLADFPSLARLADGNLTVTRLVAARWVELDPRHLFDSIVAASKEGRGLPVTELANVLFEEWPKRDPEAAIAALNGTEDFGNLENWRRRVASTLIEQDVERGLRLMSEWHVENYGPRMTAVTRWAAADPRHAAEFVLENPAGYVSRLTMETIGKEWAKTDPNRALEFALARRGELGSTLATAVLKDWAGRKLSEAADWLAAADGPTRNRLSSAFVETWAKQDAASALTWCESNLAGSGLAQAVGGVMKGAASKDVAGAAGLVAAMNPSPARAAAAAEVARKWLPEFSSDKPVAPGLIAWLGGLDAESVKRVLEQTHWRWSESDPKSMADFLASSSSDRIPASVYSTLARTMARNHPSEAIEWAGRLPEDRRNSAGTEAFSEWQRSQPDAALKWLNGLPSTDSRREPFLQSAIQVLAHHPQGAEQLAHLAATDRAAARSVIEAMPLPEDHRNRLLGVLQP